MKSLAAQAGSAALLKQTGPKEFSIVKTIRCHDPSDCGERSDVRQKVMFGDNDDSGDDDDVRGDDDARASGPQGPQCQPCCRATALGPVLMDWRVMVVWRVTGLVLGFWPSASCCDCAGEDAGDPTGVEAAAGGGRRPDRRAVVDSSRDTY